MITIPMLYRGDSIPVTMRSSNDPKHRGRTFAEFYITDGLMAKSADGGRSQHLSKPLHELVATHIGYEQGTEKNPSLQEWIAKHSPLISFSTDKDKAMHFVDRTGKKKFETSSIGDADYFLWKLFDLDVTEKETGLYSFTYKADTVNVDKFREELNSQLLQGDFTNVGKALATHFVHQHTQEDSSDHLAWLIDAPQYLQAKENLIEPNLFDRALERANKWSEWLLYPCDYEPELQGVSSRFTLNKHLDLETWFKDQS